MRREWELFVTTGVCDLQSVRAVTYQAWRRSRELGVDPHAPSRAVLRPDELATRRLWNADLLSSVQPYMLCLSLILAGRHYTVAVADRDGYWLEHRKAPDESVYESGFMMPGANWREGSVGNTGIGTVLATSEPVVVHGAEHYCHALHGLTSLGVPITVNDEIAGVLGILLPNSESAPSPLPLMQACADAVGHALANRDRLKRELLNRQRFAVLGSQLATTVHDMRNPLTVIRAMGQLGISLAGKDDAKDMFVKIIDQVDSLTGMLDDLLDTSRAEDAAEGSPADIVREVLEAAGPSCAAAGIKTDLVVSSEPRITLQARAFKRAIYNLVTNAIKAMPNGGSLVARCFTCGEGLTIEIEDTGKGIAPEVQPILFEPFVSGGGGKGLGLYMVHKTITEDHHGRIRFESGAGKGTKFIIELPIVSALRETPLTSPSETDVAAAGE